MEPVNSLDDKPSAEIVLREETIKAIQQEDRSAADLFLEDLMTEQRKVVSILMDYANEKDSLGTVHHIDDHGDLEISREGKGVLLIYYTINVYSGCRDINLDYDDEEVYLDIQVNFQRNTAMLTGPALMPKRDPDEF